MHLDRRRIGVDRHHIVGEIAVDRRAVLRIVGRVLEQRHADSHHHRTLDLVAAGQRIENAPRIDDGDHSADAQASDLRLPGDLDEVTAEGMRRKFRLWDCRMSHSPLPLPLTWRRLARRSRSAKGTPWPGPSAFTKTSPSSNARSFAACASRTAIPASSSRWSATSRSRCQPPRNGRDHRTGRHRAAGERACRKRCIAKRHFDFVERDAGLLGCELREDRIGAGADVLRGAGDAGRCHRRGAGCWPRRQIARRSRHTRPFPSRASGHRASSSRLRACAVTTRISPRRARSIRANGGKRTECPVPHRSWAR